MIILYFLVCTTTMLLLIAVFKGDVKNQFIKNKNFVLLALTISAVMGQVITLIITEIAKAFS